MDAVGAQHVGDLVRVGDDGGGALRQHCARELVDHQLRRLDVHMGIDEARHEVGARDIQGFTAVIPAEADDVAVLDRDVHVEPFLREHREDVAAGQHEVGRFVTPRDSHPVFVDDEKG